MSGIEHRGGEKPTSVPSAEEQLQEIMEDPQGFVDRARVERSGAEIVARRTRADRPTTTKGLVIGSVPSAEELLTEIFRDPNAYVDRTRAGRQANAEPSSERSPKDK